MKDFNPYPTLYRRVSVQRSYLRSKTGLDHTNYRQSSVVDEFYRDPSISICTGKELVHYQDPIYLLFNQERLNNVLGYDSAKQFLDSLNAATRDSLAQLRTQCSDEDLLATIKDRRLQKPCEIMAWARYCENNMDKFQKHVSDAVAKQQAEEQAKSTITNQEGAQ